MSEHGEHIDTYLKFINWMKLYYEPSGFVHKSWPLKV